MSDNETLRLITDLLAGRTYDLLDIYAKRLYDILSGTGYVLADKNGFIRYGYKYIEDSKKKMNTKQDIKVKEVSTINFEWQAKNRRLENLSQDEIYTLFKLRTTKIGSRDMIYSFHGLSKELNDVYEIMLEMQSRYSESKVRCLTELTKIKFLPQYPEEVKKEEVKVECGLKEIPAERMPLDSAQSSKYLRDSGLRCPFCDQADLQVGEEFECDNNGNLEVDITCLKCNRVWADIYRLVGVK